ncbi:MAG: hypothetical protein NC324_02680 [Bacteroides sp.]|nr:hypothetical protein [Bacteroides sp.]
MKKYILKKRESGALIGRYDSKREAADKMAFIIRDINDDCDEDDEEYLTPFDFILEVEESEDDIAETVRSIEDARRYLDGANPVGRERLEDVSQLIGYVGAKHVKALLAMNELFTIAEAWNKADGFVPDFADWNQRKYFPWFTYEKEAAGFVCASANYTATYANAFYGSRLCFKTSERAEQFGKQFIGLWNDVLLFR